MNAPRGAARRPFIVETKGGSRRLPPSFPNRSTQPEFDPAPDDLPEVQVGHDNDIVNEEPPSRAGGRFAAAEALFKKPVPAPEPEVDAAVDTAASELVEQTSIAPGTQEVAEAAHETSQATEGRRILPNLTQAPDPVEQMLAEQPARKPRGRRPKAKDDQPSLPLEAAAQPQEAVGPEPVATAEAAPEDARAESPAETPAETPAEATTEEARVRIMPEPPRQKLGYIARRQQIARSRYDKSTQPDFGRGEGWKKRLPRFAR
jgi:hypothetical protein